MSFWKSYWNLVVVFPAGTSSYINLKSTLIQRHRDLESTLIQSCVFSPSWSRRSVKSVCVFPSEIYHYKDLQGFRQPYGLCGLWEASCNLPNYTGALRILCKHLRCYKPLDPNNQYECWSCWRRKVPFLIFFFSFIYLHIPGGEWGRRGEHPERKTSLPLTGIAHHPSLRFFNSSLKFPYISWPYSGT